jgi:hypothetical protein
MFLHITHVLLASMVCLPSIRWASVSPNTMSGTAVATFVKRGRFVMHSEYHASSRRAIMARSNKCEVLIYIRLRSSA